MKLVLCDIRSCMGRYNACQTAIFFLDLCTDYIFMINVLVVLHFQRRGADTEHVFLEVDKRFTIMNQEIKDMKANTV